MPTADRMLFGPLVAVVILLLSGCVLQPRYGVYPAGCSGVPGDDTPPPWNKVADAVTHGPAGTGVIVEHTAVSGPPWPWTGSVPPLYVFDDEGNFETRFRNRDTLLLDPAFVEAEAEAYWVEVVGDAGYQVPDFTACDIAAMLGQAPSFRAPPGGLLFVQFVTEECDACDGVERAIDALVALHPDLPVRWMRVRLPAAVQATGSDDA